MLFAHHVQESDEAINEHSISAQYASTTVEGAVPTTNRVRVRLHCRYAREWAFVSNSGSLHAMQCHNNDVCLGEMDREEPNKLLAAATLTLSSASYDETLSKTMVVLTFHHMVKKEHLRDLRSEAKITLEKYLKLAELFVFKVLGGITDHEMAHEHATFYARNLQTLTKINEVWKPFITNVWKMLSDFYTSHLCLKYKACDIAIVAVNMALLLCNVKSSLPPNWHEPCTYEDYSESKERFRLMSLVSGSNIGLFIMGHINGVPCSMVIDTGGNVATIRKDLAQLFKDELIWMPSFVTLQTDPGDKINIYGKLNINIMVGSAAYCHTGYVADPYILRLDFLRKYYFFLGLQKQQTAFSIFKDITIRHQKGSSPGNTECLVWKTLLGKLLIPC
ncbi:hypothetical protein X975_20641, partial [Stegodyphus mimosarum]